MISVEARKYLGKYYLIVREWDGFDKPQYTPIFEITEEELDFKGGRFSRMCSYFAYKSDLIIAIPDLPRITTIQEIINWVSKNTSGNWNFDLFSAIEPQFIWKFVFETEKDAVAFKLRWGKPEAEICEFSPGQWK